MARNGFSVRKVYRTGKSLVISFPAEWERKGIVEEGQTFIVVNEEKRIVLVPAITVPVEEVKSNDLPR